MSRTVREVMTTEVVSVAPETPVKEVARLLVSRDISALPVVEGSRIAGIVSETDLLHRQGAAPESLGDRYREPLRARLRRSLGTAESPQSKARSEDAGGLMTRKVVTVGPEDTIVSAARMMERYDVKQLPVVDDRGRLMGLLSRRDLLRVFVRPDEEIARDIGAALAAAPAWLDPGDLRFVVTDGVVTIEGGLEQRSHCSVILQLVQTVDGVVGVHSKLTWNVDDTLPPRMPYTS